ncbi:hypothetical protein [Chengkuizengella axinellae]|uniref:DUF4321 domain-containing protein n=1 Tax=Chengkuizengella axinellae TaxID=3064388 RepID=A0ABT9IV15_9BACL|nr:hypothetical protein [Chengkuizengella sp. 2205SS18-9]MDP5272699.1 hypothetical protein [Chengkuizengella sp. 2205SS18-9]
MRWVISFIFLLFAILMLSKGFSLQSMIEASIDSDGIGVYFMGFVIKESAPINHISIYAAIFFIGCFMFFVFSLIIAINALLSSERLK